MHTAIPAVVTRYDSSKQLADVQPVVNQSYDDETGERVAAQLPVIPNCPVQFPGGGGYVLCYPLQPGDTGLLVFSEASIDKWLSGGGVVDPEFDHRFHLTDGIFIPGVRPFSSPHSDPGNAIVVGNDGGIQVKVSPVGIKLGGDAALQPVILGTVFNTVFLTSFTAALTAWTGALNAGPPGVTDVVQANAAKAFITAMTTIIATTQATIFSTVVKTQ